MSSESSSAIFIGSDTLLLQCVEAWRQRGHAIAAIVTDAAKVKAWAHEQGLPCRDGDGDLATTLADLRCDFLFAITWLRILPRAVLALPRHLAINFHDGPLPRYAGLNAPVHALLAGEREHGITWHQIEAQADTGAILLQRKFALQDDDTAFSVNARCFAAGVETFGELVDGLTAGSLVAQPQDPSRRTWFGRHARPAGMAVLDFAQSAAAVARVVRALDHGGYRNPIGVAKLLTGNGAFAVGAATLVGSGGAAPGTVTGIGDDFVQVATAQGEVRLSRLRTLSALPADVGRLAAAGVRVGVVLPRADAATVAARTALDEACSCGEDGWIEALRELRPLPVPQGLPANGPAVTATQTVDLGELATAEPALERAAQCALFLARASTSDAFDLGVVWPSRHPAAAAEALLVAAPPWRVVVDPRAAAPAQLAALLASLRAHGERAPLPCDLVLRHPESLRAGTELAPPVRIRLGAAGEILPGTVELCIDVRGRVQLAFDSRTLPASAARALAERLMVFVAALATMPGKALRELPVLTAEEHRRLLSWNVTAVPADPEVTVDRQFVRQATQSGAAIALRSGTQSLDYRGLEERTARLAGWLRSRGVGRGDRVGICVPRGIELVVAVLATLRVGAAYVPLDPGYPASRLQYMAEDAQLAALVVTAGSAGAAPTVAAARVDLDADASAIAATAPFRAHEANGADLAYLIYTSGSTGRPKGVMVMHQNVTNFFTGMDSLLGNEPPGVWLAVTSLSFDISVLELLWTLCRGYEVVVYGGDTRVAAPAPTLRPVRFSLFYFASDAGEHAADKYRLLLEGAKFADQHGFEAVWTPERHFYAFGGLYPNPAVASAAIAVATRNVHIRAGSCVLPLHSPIRVAEDWALVDNLSNGRVGIAFAAGWHAHDFVLQPQNFQDRKNLMFTGIRQVHALWRGETVQFPGPDGRPVGVHTLPRPIQQSLPTWVTVAGNPETYRQAGENGAFVLTHLLGQSVDELARKLAIYRQAWRDAGHAGEGKVTLMLHTFVGDDEQQVRAIVQKPLQDYLRSSVELVKEAAWSFPAFRTRVQDKPGEMEALLSGGLSAGDMDALLAFAFERYYQQSGLFGTPQSCMATVDRLRGLGVDEIACLIDFGVPTERVLQNLPHLLELKRRCELAEAVAGATTCSVAAAAATPAATIPQLIEQFGVTHLQCTPSMAGMLLHDPAAPAAMRRLRHLLVGGEALPAPLARQLRASVPHLHDMYGPTETTVWSTTFAVGDDDPVPIGKPLANQRVWVLDAHQQLVPIGMPGELWIAGAGVTAGYFRRDDLTAERFVAEPFGGPGDRMYRTGDLARWRTDGVLEFLGRVDHQVKIRGHRIELGEIEATIAGHAGVREAAVVARPGPDGDLQLRAYVVARHGHGDLEALRTWLRSRLPEFMVPTVFVALADLPRTPNQKIDRNALPEPAVAAAPRAVVAAGNDIEATILRIWQQVLGSEAVGVEDNFFDSGGHSLLAVKVHRAIEQQLQLTLPVTDLFRFTTVRALARHLRADTGTPTAAQQAVERAQKRRNLLRRSP
ncbi:MAG: LLM class flavin-dependent oxidoreductase [Planctomycetes bacterium]|nr:LLM class flavin-dependent oxidoreductase [Planctomycetota bacterium]